MYLVVPRGYTHLLPLPGRSWMHALRNSSMDHVYRIYKKYNSVGSVGTDDVVHVAINGLNSPAYVRATWRTRLVYPVLAVYFVELVSR